MSGDHGGRRLSVALVLGLGLGAGGLFWQAWQAHEATIGHHDRLISRLPPGADRDLAAGLAQDSLQRWRVQMAGSAGLLGLLAGGLVWRARRPERRPPDASPASTPPATLPAELARALALSQVGIWRMEFPGERFTGSPEAYRSFGLAPDGPVTRTALQAPVHPEDLPRVREAWDAVRRGVPVELEYRLTRLGAVHVVHLGAWPELDARGQVTAVDGTVQDVTVCKRSEQLLAGYARTVEASGDALAYIGPDFSLQLANPAFLELFGLDAREALGRPLSELEGAAASSQLGDCLALAMAGQGRRFNLERAGTEGAPQVWDVSCQPDRSGGEAGGVVGGAVLAIHDISQQVMAERRIRDGELKLRAVFDTPFIMSGLLDLEGRVQQMNAAALALLGRRSDEVAGLTLWDAAWPLFDAAALDRLREAVASGARGEASRFETDYVDRCGERRRLDFALQPVFGAQDRVVWLVPQAIDVTERGQMLEALRQERDFVNAILEAAGSAIAVLDRHGRIVRFNRTAEVLTGYSAAELIGQPVWEYLIPPEQRPAVRKVFDHLMANQIVREYENAWLTRDGGRRLLQWRNSVLTDGAGRVTHVVTQGYDLSELRAKDDLLRRDREQQATLRRLLEIILAGAGLESTLQDFLGHLLDLSWLAVEPRGAILLPEPDGQSLRMAVSRNIDDQTLSQCGRVPLGRCLCGRAAQTHAVQFADGADGRRESQCDGLVGHGHYALPLLLGERLQGVLVLYLPKGFQRDPATEEFLSTVTDILSGYLARVADEQALRASEDLTRGVMDSISSSIAVLDQAGVILRVNKAWQGAVEDGPGVALLNARVGGNYLAGVGQAAVAGDDVASQVRLGMLSVRDGGSPGFGLEYAVPGAEPPRWFDMQVTPLGARVRGLVVTQTNITTRKLAEIELERYKAQLEDRVVARTAELGAAEAQVRLILESTADGLFGMDTAGCFTFVNPVACAMLGYRSEALIGKHVHTTIHHHYEDGQCYPEKDCPMLETLRVGTVVREREEVFWCADGRALPVKYATHPMIRQGEIVGMVVGFSDATRARETEAARAQALAEAERLARVRSEFLANMSHEIRTPLNAVLGLAQVGLRESEKRKSQETFTRILDSGQLLLGIINDILDFSKIEAGRLSLEQRLFSPAGVIDQAVNLVASRAFAQGLEFRLEEPADLPEQCAGDDLRIVQVLVNLLSNAIKFTRRGQVTLSAWRDGEALCFRVADTGIGMSPDQIGRLFKPFEQADGSTTRLFGGTGLGLAISKRLVGLMGGRLTVESAPEQGSRFELRLPSEVMAPAQQAPQVGRVALLGFGAEAAARVRAELAPWHLDGGAAPETADLLLYDAEAGADPGALRSAVTAALAAGRRVCRLVTPGRGAAPEPPAESVLTLERPLRPRLLWAALRLPAQAPAEPGDQDRRRRLDGVRVLAAEDNEVNRMVLGEMLHSAGATLDCFENGAEAVAHFARCAPGSYDIMLTDVQMPVMDGYETTRRIHALNPGLPVVGITAHALPEEKARCLAAGMAEHVAKPLELEILVAAILRHVPRRSEPAHAGNAQARVGEPASPPAAPASAPARPTPTDQAVDAVDAVERTRDAAEVGAGDEADPEAVAIGWAKLEARFGGKKDFVDKLVRTALTSQRDSPETLRQAAARGDYAALAFAAHALKGMGGSLAVARIQAQAAETEQAARAGAAHAPELALALAEVMERFLARTLR